MPSERYFFDSPFEDKAEIQLVDQEFHHLSRVMRAKVGDIVELVNGKGQLALAKIAALEKKQASLTIQSVFIEPKPSFEIVLAQAIPRGNRLDFILEKGTELGMTALWLFPAELSERKNLTENHMERMHSLTVAAMKQCGRLYLPKISFHLSLSTWQPLPFPAFYGDVRSTAPLFVNNLLEIKPKKGVIFFIGPESGFQENEIKNLQALQVQGVKLHPNILRTDTAAISALTLISHLKPMIEP